MKHIKLIGLLALSMALASCEKVSLDELLSKEPPTSHLTSSLRHPKIFIKEFGDFLMPCHQHCLSVYILVQR